MQATGDDVPLIIRSCIRVINLYGKWFYLLVLVFDLIS